MNRCDTGASRTSATLAGGLAGAVTLAAMIATPLLTPRGLGRRRLSSVVVAGLAATTFAASTRRWGVGPAGRALGAVAAATGLVEKVGTATGRPFGHYGYTGALRPQVAGIPVVVPLAWFAMAVPARETAHAVLGVRSTRLARIVLGSAALTAWDLFLDPQMVGEGYWAWRRTGRYRGIPATNFVGWFATGVGVMTVLDRLLPAAQEPADALLVGEYGVVAVMETVGFARYFRDPVVAWVGGASMLPIAAVAVVRRIGR